MKAMLFAAGLGTRLKPFTDHSPKAMVRVNDKTLLEHNIRYLQRAGIYDVVVNVHHFAQQIEDELNDNNGFGSNVVISDERDAVLETGGGLKKAAHLFAGEESIVVMNVDILTNLDLSKMIDYHLAYMPAATLAVMQRNSSRQLLFDASMNLCGWQHSGTGEQKISRVVPDSTPFAFSGIQLITTSAIAQIPFEGKFSLIDAYLHLATCHDIKGYIHTGNIFIDVGKPESVAQASYLFMAERQDNDGTNNIP